MAPRYRCTGVLLATLLLTASAYAQQSIHPLPDAYSSPGPGRLAESLRARPLPADRATVPMPGFQSSKSGLVASLASPDASQLIQQLSKVWDPSANGGAGDWQDESRVTYTRNSAGFSTELLVEDWDFITGGWVNSYRQTTTRDAMNHAVQEVSEEWDLAASAWNPALRTTRTYDSQGRIETNTTEFYDEDLGGWYVYGRSTYSYEGTSTRRHQLVYESGLFGPLTPSFRYTFEYNGNGQTVRRLTENYDSGTSTFVNAGDRRWTYDSNGQETEDLELTWNSSSASWFNNHRTTTEYAPNSTAPTQIVETEEDWDIVAGAWVNDQRHMTEGSPDLASPGETTETDQEWDASANGGQGAWVNTDRWIGSFTDGVPTSVLTQEWDGAAWVNTDRETVEYDGSGNVTSSLGEVWEGSAWVNSTLLLMTYEDFSSTATEPDVVAQGFRLDTNYPNPFSAATTIGFALPTAQHVTLEVFDMLGRRVSTAVDARLAPGEHEATIEGKSLPAGLYVYRLVGERFRASRSMLLVR